MSRKCPKCQTEMEIKDWRGAKVWICPKIGCGQIPLITKTTLQSLIKVQAEGD